MATTRIAVLDANGVYKGLIDVDEAAVKEDDVVLEACDLPPDRYVWSRVHKAFLPIAPPTVVQQVEAPNALNAIALALLALEQGKPMPAEALAWLEHYIETIDFAKSARANAALVREFKERPKG